jgi:Winged helix-turn-helix DNA-binding
MNHFPDKLTERAVLDHIKKYPRCSNALLAREIGFSVGGTEKLLRRLRGARHIRQTGKGCARFMFSVEHLTSGGISHADEPLPEGEVRPRLSVAKREMPTGDFIAERLSYFENCMEVGDYEHARKHLELARQRLEMDADFPAQERANLLACLKVAEDRRFAFSVGAVMADGRPVSEQRELARTLCRASAEQLAVFRERVEAGASLKNSDGIVALIGG